MNLTNAELNKLSVADLEDLNKRVVSVIRIKIAAESLNAVNNFEIGMTVRYTGNGKLHNTLFEVIKINKVNVVCENLISKEKWNIKASALEIEK